MNSTIRKAGSIAIGAGLGWLATRTLLRVARSIEFRNRVVLITGGARGLGLVIARQLAGEGARLALCSRSANDLENAAQELRARGAEVLTHRCDVRQQDEVHDLVNRVRESLGPVDVLINNAGVIQVGPLETMTVEDFENAMDTHFWGPVNTVRECLPDMRRRGFGRIVNIASFGGEISVPHLLPYCASKFALVGFSRGLRTSLSNEGIYVTTVCPGLMRTGSHVNALFKGQHRAEFAWFSIGGALPVASVSAEQAAGAIISACREGRAELHISLPARFISAVSRLLPELIAEASSVVDRLLPKSGGIGTDQVRGRESQSQWSPSWATRLSDEAAKANNEL